MSDRSGRSYDVGGALGAARAEVRVEERTDRPAGDRWFGESPDRELGRFVQDVSRHDAKNAKKTGPFFLAILASRREVFFPNEVSARCC